jgi:hypothetical protein
MQVDGNVEPLLPQAAREREVGAHSGKTASPRNHNDVSQITITADDRGGSRFDHIGELALGIAPSEGANQRRREHHVANQP